MKRPEFLAILILTLFYHVSAQAQQVLNFNKEYKDINLAKPDTLVYKLPLLKDGMYKFSILQKGIAVYYKLTSPSGEKAYENADIYALDGYEKFDYTATTSGNFILTISRFEHNANPDSGQINILVKRLSKKEIEEKKQIKKDLEAENAKNVTTIDIDHFWNAFDSLRNCKS